MSRSKTDRLTHLDNDGNAHMVDVGGKPDSLRIARARGTVTMRTETLSLIAAGNIKKGDVLATARLAGIQAAKRTPELIPLCHTLLLTGVEVELEPEPAHNRIRITAVCKATGKTGVEMEALTAVSAAALTIYDMCKAVDRGMCIGDIVLVSKSGGQSGDWIRETE